MIPVWLRQGLRLLEMGAVLLALVACGGGHSSDATGPSTSTSSGTSGSGEVDFGSNDPRVVSAFGDSITFGVLEERKVRSGLSTSNNYPNILQGMLRGLDPAWRVVNRGQPGELVQTGANRIAGVLRADQPGFILIMEGTNNATEDDDPAFIMGALESMVNSARANKTIPILATIPPNFRNDPGAQDVIDQTNPKIRAFAASQDVALAEIFNGMNDRTLFGQSPDRDPLHPNERGYQVMAQIWFDALQKVAPGGGKAAALRPRTKSAPARPGATAPPRRKP